MKTIDKFLNSITMYRLMLYGLTAISVYAIILEFFGSLSIGGGLALIGSLVVLLFGSFGSNYLFAKLFGVPANIESSWITGYILFLVMQPATDLTGYLWLLGVAFIAMLSKYVLVIHRKHIFNPAAIALFIVGVSGSGMAIWWVGSALMLPIVLIIGLLIVRKIKRFPLFFAFIISSLMVMLYAFTSLGSSASEVLKLAFTSFPLIFFATIMLTEPLTAPPTKRLQVIYGVIIGVLFSSQFSIGPVYTTPEFALVVGNIFSYFVSSNRKFLLTLKSHSKLSNLIHEFSFASDHKIDFKPGQYLEWTFPHENADTRGIRRFFTIASSPTEDDVKLGVRIQDGGSSFKKQLSESGAGTVVFAGSLSGEFTLPKDQNIKLVFIAGGIGVTPFRSMIKYLVDKKEKRDITLFYACAAENDFVYDDLFNEATSTIGLSLIKVVTDTTKVSEMWKGKTGFITKELIESVVPDYKDRVFYLSGPDAMVQNYKQLLIASGIKRCQIKTDYFPGF